jgi:CotH kinase protein/Lamin Tail Domain/Chitobiase/beta-hexosaminidase C-terminal domain
MFHSKGVRRVRPFRAFAFALACTPLAAGTLTVDFNQNPSTAGYLATTPIGSGQWRPSGGATGAAGDGYFSITDAASGQSATLIFNDIDNGRVVTGFTFEADLRIGGSTSGSPADGFSISYCSAGDPVVSRANGTGWAGTDGETGTDVDPNASGLPEEGTSTGVSVGFDSWQSGGIRGVQDVIGISLRNDGPLVAQFPVPLMPGNIYYATPNPPPFVADGSGTYGNLPPVDPNYHKSLQTGPLNPAYNSADITTSWALLHWEHLNFSYDPAGGFHLSWKGVELTPSAGLPLVFRPRNGRLVIGGRTGGANQNHHIDNVALATSVAVAPVVGAVTGNTAGFSVSITDGPTAPVNTTSLHLKLNGTDVTTAGTISQSPGLTTFIYHVADPAHRLPAGSTNTVSVSGSDTAGHAFSGTGIFVAAPPPQTVRISEFMAANKTTLNDEDGASSDWIEIFNPTPSDVNLQGWHLTDKATNLTQWTFPAYVLQPGDRLVVFASGKNRTNNTSELHTNFKLAAAGGYLALVDATGGVASSFEPSYPAQQTDVSYGADEWQPDLLASFPNPTPGAPNLPSGAGFTPSVGFSRAGGTFTAPFLLALTNTTPGAVIHYTLDGSTPTDGSTVYTGPIAVTTSVQVRARAFAPGLAPGAPHSETYLLIASDLASFQSALPVVVIYNYGAGPVSTDVSAPPQFVHFALFEPTNGVTRLTGGPSLSSRGEIKVRGSSTRGLPKQAWTASFLDELSNTVRQTPFGLPPGVDWAFYAPDLFEPVMIHNPLAYRLSNEIGRYAPRTKICEVIIALNAGTVSYSDYNGIYVLEEKIQRSAERVDINALQTTNNTPPAVTGGYILRIDRLGVGESGLGVGGMTVAYDYPKEAELRTPQRAPQLAYIGQYMNNFYSTLYGSNYRNPLLGYRAYIDPEAWVDHHILNVVTFNVDALRLSAYFYKPRLGPIYFGPVWDFDRTQGSTDGRDFNPNVWRAMTGDMGTDFFNFPWWDRLFSDPDFFQKWIDRYQELRAGVLSANHLDADIDDLAGQVATAQPREAVRWAGYTTPRSGVVSVDGYSYNFPGTYQGEVVFLKKWYADRLHFIDTNFLDRPVFTTPGGPVPPGFTLTITAPPGASIYYTLDGSDPRRSGGAVSALAHLYSGPVPINGAAVVTARAFNAAHRNATGANNPPLSSSWSGVVRATYGFVSSPSAFAYGPAGAVYQQGFETLPDPGRGSVDPSNPVTLNGVSYSLANPFALAAAPSTPGGFGGLNAGPALDGWYGAGVITAKFGAGDGDQSTGGVESFGPLDGDGASTNRALGLMATSSTGQTAFALRLLNNSGAPLGRMSLAYTGELWRQSAVAKTIAFSYWVDPAGTNGFPASTNTLAVPPLNIAFAPDPALSSPAAANGLDPANQTQVGITNFALPEWPAGGALWLVWRMDSAASKGQGLAIDDLTFSALPPEPPTLSAQLDSGRLTISWPEAPAFSLEAAADIGPGSMWTPIHPALITTNGSNVARILLDGPAQYFRLVLQ